jgi:hypothetical protein
MGHQQCGEERLFVGIDPDGGIELMGRGRAVLDFFRYGRNLCFAFEPSL